MKTRKRALIIVILLLLGIGFVAWRKHPAPASIRLDLTGTPGLKVAGTITIDGAQRQFTGVLPTSVSAKAKSFEYTILIQEPNGELRGELTVDNGIYGSSSTANDFSGVRGSYSHSWLGKGGMMTTAKKGD
jgi:hypothetical protein